MGPETKDQASWPKNEFGIGMENTVDMGISIQNPYILLKSM